MAEAPYGDGLYAKEPPISNLNITDTFNIVTPKSYDPDINSAVDTQYPNVMIITFDRQNQFGGMWAKEQIDLTMPFSTHIYLYLGREYGSNTNIADGMTFTLHNDPDGVEAIGGAGEGLGVFKGRKHGNGDNTVTTPHGTYLRNSLIIEFDTFRNEKIEGVFVDDPPGVAHCSLIIPHADIIEIEDHKNVFNFVPVQDWVLFEADWIPDGSNGGTLTYSFDNEQRTYVIDDVMSVFNDTKVYWGFTGATGGWTAVQAAAIVKLPTQGVTVEKMVLNSFGDDVNHGKVLPNEVLTYVIKVTAQELSDTIGPIQIDDSISEYLEDISDDIQTITSDGGSFTVPYSTSPPDMVIEVMHYLSNSNEWIELFFTAKVKADAAAKTIYNQSVVTVGGLEGTYQTNMTDVSVFSDPEKSVSATSSAGRNGSAVHVGDLVTYDIFYANDSAVEQTVIITDVLDNGVDFIAASGGHYDITTRTVTWTLNNTAPSFIGSVSLTVRVNADAVVRIENVASVKLGDDEPNVTNSVINEVISPPPTKKIADDSQSGKNESMVRFGDSISYEISYANYTDSDTSIVITDRLPTGVDFDSATDNGEYNPDTHIVTWNFANVTSGVVGTVRVTVRVNERAVFMIENYAVITVGSDTPSFTNGVINLIRDSSHCIDVRQITPCRQTITGRKIWADNDNESGLRPPSAEILLFRDDTLYKSTSVDSSGNGVFNFGCLPIWRDSTYKYKYRIDEAAVADGYMKTIDGYNIINTFV